MKVGGNGRSEIGTSIKRRVPDVRYALPNRRVEPRDLASYRSRTYLFVLIRGHRDSGLLSDRFYSEILHIQHDF